MDARLRAVIGFLAGFDAAARSLSFTRAAAELDLTQSAMSRQIQALEQALGVKLFERFNRRLVLTAAGGSLHRAVAILLRELDDAFVRLSSAGRGNVVTVGATVSFASLWLVPRLAAFRRAHPDISVHIAADNALVELGTRGIDVNVRFCRADMAPVGATGLFAEEVFPVCAPSLLRKGAPALRAPRDLDHQVLLHYDDVRSYPWLEWAQWLTANGVPGVTGAGGPRFSHYDQLIQAAVAGEGVALGRTPLIEHLLRSGRLVAPLRGRAASRRQYFLIGPRAEDASPPVRAFMRWLTDEALAAAEHPMAMPATASASQAAPQSTPAPIARSLPPAINRRAAATPRPARDTPPPARSRYSSRPGRADPGPATGAARRRAR